MSEHAIAIIGIACRLPAANNLATLWEHLVSGRILATRYDREALIRLGVAESVITANNYVPVDSCLPDRDKFDPDFFSISQREAELLDPQHRILLECAWELAEIIGYGNSFQRPRIGIFSGSSMNTYLLNIIQSVCDLVSPMGTELMLANDKDYLSSRISYKLGFEGPSVTLQSGCSTSLMAVHSAIQSLLLGECEIAFAGGVSVHVYPRPGYFYQHDMIFSEDGYCRPFDERASGTFFGDGAGLVALRPLNDAIRQGDTIHAVILGSATNNDGANRAGFTAPSVDGQRKLLLDTQAIADVKAEELGMIEAHGTATSLGDSVEYAALLQAFRQQTERVGFCALGSIKANVGHLAAAAGFAGLAKTIMALKSGTIAPHPTFSKANPAMKLEKSPFLINTTPIDWPLKGIRRAGVSSFGAGGSNVHLILQQAPDRILNKSQLNWRAIPLGGRDVNALTTLSANLAQTLEAAPSTDLDAIAFTYAEGRALQPYRACWYAKDVKTLIGGIKNRDLTATAPCSEPPCLVMALGSGIRSSLSMKHPFYLQTIAQLLPQRSEVYVNDGDRIDIAEIIMDEYGLPESPDIANDIVEVVTAIAHINCWKRLILTPIVLLSNSRYDLAVACSLGMLTLSEVVGKLRGNRSCHLTGCHTISPGSFWSKDHGMIDANNAREILIAGVSSMLQPAQEPLAADKIVLDFSQIPDDFSSVVSDTDNIIRVSASNHQDRDQALVVLLGTLWQRGVMIDWSLLRQDQIFPRIPLPVQPLRRRRCWYATEEKGSKGKTKEIEYQATLATDHSTATPDPRILPMSGGVYVERWKRVQRLSAITSPLVNRQWLIFYDSCYDGVECDGMGLIADRLRHLNQRVIEVQDNRTISCDGKAFFVNVEDVNSTQRLLAALFHQADSTVHLLFLLGSAASRDKADRSKRYLPSSLFNLVKALSQVGKSIISVTLIGEGFVNVTGSEQCIVERAAALAAIPAINQEFLNMILKVIDIPFKESSDLDGIQRLVTELCIDSGPIVIGVRQGWRWERYFEALSPLVNQQVHRSTLGDVDRVCLVTGGLGTVGFGMARQLATKFNAKLILLVRSALESSSPDTLYAQRLAELRKIGVNFEVITADVTDKSCLAAELRRVQPIVGKPNCFIHAAGPSGQAAVQWLQNSDQSDWERVVQPKLEGAKVLHELFADHSLIFGCFVSSLSVFAGGLGLASYAAANEACAAFAASHGIQRPYFTIDWDGWEGWDRANSFRYSASRACALNYDQIGSALNTVFETFHQEARFVVSITPLNERLHGIVNALPSAGQEEDNNDDNNIVPVVVPQLRSELAIIEEITAIWHDVLHCHIDPESNFFDLGGDSLVGTELMRRINAHFKISLSMVDLFECSTVISLTAQVKKKSKIEGDLWQH